MLMIFFAVMACTDKENTDVEQAQSGDCSDTLVLNEVLSDESDLVQGTFTLTQALVDFPEGEGALLAVIRTSMGDITCELQEEAVPNAVANFVGLARGTRPWFSDSDGAWVQRPFYEGLIFHRIIDDFMIQGGDPMGNGYGGPGYEFADEFAGLRHQPGTLAYANAGANTNGSQFYITEVATEFLDGGYTIFGYCTPLSTIEEIAAVETDSMDKPIQDVIIEGVDITRCIP